MKRFRLLAAAGVAVAAFSTVAYAAGLWSTLPIVGQPSFCGSTVSGTGNLSGITGQGQGTLGSICGQTIPAGPPALTDEELIPADTGLSGGASPQTIVIPSGMLGGINLKVNRLIGGDFATNLWQRGTNPLTGASPTTAAMTADRWWAISASNVVTVQKTTPASSAADYLGNIGLYSWMQVARPSGTPSGVTCVGQTLDKEAASTLIGNNAVLSFYGYAPSTFSASNQNITVTIAYFTAADASSGQTAVGQAGVNSKTFALSASGQNSGITGYTAVTATAGMPGYPTATIASGVATVGLLTTPTRFTVYGAIPALNASGTAVTGVGIAFCATPTATTTVSTDFFEITGVQLQAMPNTATINLPNGIVAPTGFERRYPSIEADLQLYYSYVVNEVASSSSHPHASGYNGGTTTAQEYVAFPIPMRITPAAQYTAGFGVTNATGTAQACTALATVANSLNTNSATVQCTVSSGLTGGNGNIFEDAAGTGVLSFSAEP